MLKLILLVFSFAGSIAFAQSNHVLLEREIRDYLKNAYKCSIGTEGVDLLTVRLTTPHTGPFGIRFDGKKKTYAFSGCVQSGITKEQIISGSSISTHSINELKKCLLQADQRRCTSGAKPKTKTVSKLFLQDEYSTPFLEADGELVVQRRTDGYQEWNESDHSWEEWTVYSLRSSLRCVGPSSNFVFPLYFMSAEDLAIIFYQENFVPADPNDISGTWLRRWD